MAKKAKLSKPDIEYYEDAWQRFERATDVVAKSAPQPKIKSKRKKKKSPAKRKT